MHKPKFVMPNFSLFRFTIGILSFKLILPISELQVQWLMTSWSGPRIEYFILTYNILVLLWNQIGLKI